LFLLTWSGYRAPKFPGNFTYFSFLFEKYFWNVGLIADSPGGLDTFVEKYVLHGYCDLKGKMCY